MGTSTNLGSNSREEQGNFLKRGWVAPSALIGILGLLLTALGLYLSHKPPPKVKPIPVATLDPRDETSILEPNVDPSGQVIIGDLVISNAAINNVKGGTSVPKTQPLTFPDGNAMSVRQEKQLQFMLNQLGPAPADVVSAAGLSVTRVESDLDRPLRFTLFIRNGKDHAIRNVQIAVTIYLDTCKTGRVVAQVPIDDAFVSTDTIPSKATLITVLGISKDAIKDTSTNLRDQRFCEDYSFVSS
jgi:SLAP domain-containing protein